MSQWTIDESPLSNGVKRQAVSLAADPHTRKVIIEYTSPASHNDGVERLLRRAADGIVREVVLATNFTVEGEATAHHLGELLRARGLAVSRLARGVPVGGELEYVDSGTLAQAFRDRRVVH